MKISIALITTSLLYSTHCFALFCPTNFNQVEIGDTLAKVEKQCGKPDLSNIFQNEENMPQEWTYFLQVPTYGMAPGPNNNPGTLKVTIAFVGGKAVNISSNGIGVGATAICNNINLEIGSNIKDVEKACGKPALMTKTDQSLANGEAPRPIQIVEWTYSTSPPVTFVFQDGVMTERK